jgi:hypothetical protein
MSRFTIVFATLFMLSWGGTQLLNAACPGSHDCSCHVQCPRCQSYCKLEVEKELEKKHCWKVECETICIPPVRFPWQRGCPAKCAKTRTVRVLKKHEYECDVCSYQWTAVEMPCCEEKIEHEGESKPPAPIPADSLQPTPPKPTAAT